MSKRVRLRKCLALCAGLLLLKTMCLDWYRVTGRSMLPMLHSGDLLLCNRLAYGLHLPGMAEPLLSWSRPQPDELVLFSAPVDGRLCVKRVVYPPTGTSLTPDHFWAEGDNRNNSYDSRNYGPVSRYRVYGRATLLIQRANEGCEM